MSVVLNTMCRIRIPRGSIEAWETGVPQQGSSSSWTSCTQDGFRGQLLGSGGDEEALGLGCAGDTVGGLLDRVCGNQAVVKDDCLCGL